MEGRNKNILVALTALVIAVAIFSSFGMGLFSGPTATITLPSYSPTESAKPEQSGESGGVRVEVTPTTVQSVIAAMSRLESYSRVVTVTLEGASSTALVWEDNGWNRCDLTLPTGLTVHTIVGDGTVYRWNNEEEETFTWPAGERSVDVDGQRIPTYEDVLALDTDSITAAGYENKNGFPCVYVEVAVPELAQVERYWVSSDTGLLMAAETEANGVVVYSMVAAAAEIPAPAWASFRLPDGTVLHTVGDKGVTRTLQQEHKPQRDEQLQVVLPVVQEEKQENEQ